MKSVLVTGANRGLGFECCRLLAGRGWRVFAGARDVAALREAVSGLDGEVVPLELDVLSVDSVKRAIRAIKEVAGGLDALLNNAAVYPAGDDRPWDIGHDEMARTLLTNVAGVHLVLREALPLLRAVPAARVVNVSSVLGSFEQCVPGGEYGDHIAVSYGSSKAAVNMLTVEWAKALAGSGITVDCVTPGWCRTAMGGERAPRRAEEGAELLCAHLETDGGSTGGRFLGPGGVVPW
jgi:NAD(P)-dependent dehydrogenase (short-subunit alcohol dehydrogenase family)